MIEIVFSALLFSLGFWIIFQSFYRAGDAIDCVLEGRKINWVLLGLWLLVSIGGALLSVGAIVYWIV